MLYTIGLQKVMEFIANKPRVVVGNKLIVLEGHVVRKSFGDN